MASILSTLARGALLGAVCAVFNYPLISRLESFSLERVTLAQCAPIRGGQAACYTDPAVAVNCGAASVKGACSGTNCPTNDNGVPQGCPAGTLGFVSHNNTLDGPNCPQVAPPNGVVDCAVNGAAYCNFVRKCTGCNETPPYSGTWKCGNGSPQGDGQKYTEATAAGDACPPPKGGK